MLVIVFGIFLKIYNYTYFKLYLANKLYDFKNIPKNLKKKLAEQLDFPTEMPILNS